jgi:hypothetical protein
MTSYLIPHCLLPRFSMALPLSRLSMVVNFISNSLLSGLSITLMYRILVVKAHNDSQPYAKVVLAEVSRS